MSLESEMSRKDYEKIAGILRRDRLFSLSAVGVYGDDMSRSTALAQCVRRCDDMVSQFSDMLAADNDSFDRVKFDKASGYGFGTVL
jgi:hypothetical protein